uniref:Putative insulin-like protein growth factor binding protein n=1 Tax=Tityus obscurus TaxID=1221240 RepID=A0A1E1WVU2_TITOB
MDLRFLTLLFLSVCLYSVVVSLSCRPCDKSACKQLSEADCPVGITSDTCGCCQVCAKNAGEDCGGPWKVYGRCGKGLECVKPPSPSGDDSYLYQFNSKGKCQ